MRVPKTRLLAPVLSLALAVGLFVQMQAYAAEDDTTAYHAAVATAAEELPIRIGDWDGDDIPMPPAAGKLLRPNVMLARRYIGPERQWANLVLVQCFDSRDMSGHYPPNCYPGNGWTTAGPARVAEHELWGASVPMAEYRFTRSDGSRTTSTVIYNFFVLPTMGFVTSMSEVRAASGDYRARPYGAAQVQVIFDAGMGETERLAALTEVLEPLGPVVRLLQSTKMGEKK